FLILFSYRLCFAFVFSFHYPPTTYINTLSLHDALPISARATGSPRPSPATVRRPRDPTARPSRTTTGGTRPRSARPCSTSGRSRSEEHTSELQSRGHLVCRLLLEKKKKYILLPHLRRSL